jgi:hypothetical protein
MEKLKGDCGYIISILIFNVSGAAKSLDFSRFRPFYTILYATNNLSASQPENIYSFGKLEVCS